MDIDEFSRNFTPKARRSRLEPFKAEIFELHARGYSDTQIRDWLALNSITITRQSVQKFIQARHNQSPPTNTTPPSTSNQTVSRTIQNPADIRRARKRDIDLSQYSEPEKD